MVEIEIEIGWTVSDDVQVHIPTAKLPLDRPHPHPHPPSGRGLILGIR